MWQFAKIVRRTRPVYATSMRLHQTKQDVSQREIRAKLRELAHLYPADMVRDQLADIPRIAFNISLSIPIGISLEKAVLYDIGGGVGLFSLGCAVLGFRKVILVDDFQDHVNRRLGESILDLHHRYGITIVSRNVITEGLGRLSERADVVTSFDSMEHWHHSPKRLFHQLMSLLNLAGRFVLGVPNCVNLRKRLTVPFGYGRWSAIEDWYEQSLFRGHVREPDINDLRYIARDLGLTDVRILGCNWLGYSAKNPLLRIANHLSDPVLRFRPSLCSDLYLVGRKPVD